MWVGVGWSGREGVARAALALAAAAVLAVVPGGFVPFLFPKLLVLSVVVLLAALAPGRGRLPGWTGAAALIGSAGFVAAALVGGTPVASLLGRWPRYEGVVLLALVAGCAWAGARLLGPGAPAGRWWWAVAVTSAAAIVLLAWSVLEATGLRPLGTSASRSGSLLGNATDQGLAAAGIAVLLAGAVPRVAGRGRAVAGAGGAAALATVLLSGSRTSALALVVGLVVLTVLGRNRVVALLSAGVVAVGAIGALVVPQMSDRLGSSRTVVGRRLLWQESWRIARDHLGHGIGPSRLVDVLPAGHTSTWVARVGTADPPDSPHDLFLQLLLAGGVPVLAVGSATVVVLAVAGVRAARSRPELVPLLAALAVGLVGVLVNPTSPTLLCLLALLAGAVVALPAPGPEQTSGRLETAGRLAVGTAATVLALAMASATASEVALRDGLDAAATGAPAHAAALLDRARALRAGDSDTCLLGAQALAQRADGSADPAVRGDAARQALRLAACALRRTPQAVGALTAAGVAHLDLGEPDAALAALEEAARLDPTDPQLPGLLARAARSSRAAR